MLFYLVVQKMVLNKKNIVQNITLLLFLILCISGLFSMLQATHRYNILPSNLMVECSILFFTFLYITSLNKKIMFFTIVVFIYLLYTFIKGIIFDKINIFDYIIAYKAFFYIFILSFFIKKDIYSKEFLFKLLRMLLIFFFIKYFVSVATKIELRPGVFTENNFELMFILILFYLEYILLNKKINLLNTFLLVCIFILSGSRSGIATLGFLFFMMYAFKLDKKILIRLIFVVLIFAIIIFIFMQRGQVITSTDRFRFFMFFLYDIKDWGLINFLFGSNGVLVPLSDFTCNELSYYDSLFSHKGDGSCYSVIYHSYILRAVYDHGLAGLFFICTFYFYALKISKFSTWQSLTILGIILLNSLSVSAFNNVFIIVAIIFVLGVNKNDKVIEKSK